MFDLSNLYKDSRTRGDNPDCEGCSILNKQKPCHSVMDYETLSESPVLFLSDSLKHKTGSTTAFSSAEFKLIRECYPSDFVCAASVKCPGVRDADMGTKDRVLCRKHLDATIDKVKPKLIFACGNLAMKMLLKKSGITNKRGKCFTVSSKNGHTCKVVPIFHPFVCLQEPANLPLFKKDISNAYEMYILGRVSEGDFSYSVLTTLDDVSTLRRQLKDISRTISVDIETTGLNFKTDKIQTIAISTREKNYVIPLEHKDSPFSEDDLVYVYESIKVILENPYNKKVFHNAKFDLKFLIGRGIFVKNVYDTKIMHHLLDENMPKGLMDLVKLYFPTELENL